MYHTIIIECQTRNGNLNCEDCAAYKTCRLQKKLQSSEIEQHVELEEFPVQCH
ncbi:MAG: hypothetical protein NWF05_03310 [Candidatus Bathyarchaeota archaeon]|nr:hypothetical protein [Candidatus Bathyarchaeota archaeon]